MRSTRKGGVLEDGIPAGSTNSAVAEQELCGTSTTKLETEDRQNSASKHIPEIHGKESEHLQRAVRYLPR